MSTDSAAAVVPGSDAIDSRSRSARFLDSVLRQTFVDPVAAGRLRNLDWPYGLAAVVAAAYAMFALAALIVILSGPVRQQGALIIGGSASVGLPEVAVWPLVVLLSFGTACLMTAALHGPWWLKILGLLFGLIISGSWTLRSAELSGGLVWPLAGAVIMLALVVLVVLRWRRSFAWVEFAVFWALVGGAMAVGVGGAREAKRFGFELSGQLLQQTAMTLGFLALPAALVAGAAVAEITVRATVAASRAANRLAPRSWPFVILAVVLLARAVQAVLEWLNRDPVSQGVIAYLPAAVIVLGFAGVGAVVLRIASRREARPVVSELGDELGSVGFTVAAALILLQLPVQVLLAVVQAVASLNPELLTERFAADPTQLVGDLVDPVRIVLGVVLIVLAVVYARRGRPGRALVLGCIGVMLIVLARALVLGDTVAAPIDPDVLNLVGTALVLAALAVTVVRKRLTGRRAVTFAGILILSALFSGRDFVSDPLGFVLGFSGAALVLFGLTWDLLTESGWGNGHSRRFPRPTRVLLVLTNYVLTMTVLAYAALVRDGSTTIYLDPYAEVGNLVFGTALLGAAVLCALDAAWRDAPLD